jgi:hypothetical protein
VPTSSRRANLRRSYGIRHDQPLIAAPAQDSNLRPAALLLELHRRPDHQLVHADRRVLFPCSGSPARVSNPRSTRSAPRLTSQVTPRQPLPLFTTVAQSRRNSREPAGRSGNSPNKKMALTRVKPQVRVIKADESGCTPGSVTRPPRGDQGDGHPSRAGVATGLVRSTRGLGRAALERPRRARFLRRLLLTLLRVGFT